MSEPTLAQLLTAFRSGDHGDAQRLAARLGAMRTDTCLIAERVTMLELAVFQDVTGLNERLAKLERIAAGEDTPEDLTDQVFARVVGARETKPMAPEGARPPTRLGDEFPDGPSANATTWVKIGTLPIGVAFRFGGREYAKARVSPEGDVFSEGGAGGIWAHPGTHVEPCASAPPDRFESVQGSELKEGDVVRHPGETHEQTLGPIDNRNQARFREFRCGGGELYRVWNDSKFERLVRPAAAEVKSPQPHDLPEFGSAPKETAPSEPASLEDFLNTDRSLWWVCNWCGVDYMRTDETKRVVAGPKSKDGQTSICFDCLAKVGALVAVRARDLETASSRTPVRVDSLKVGDKCWVPVTVAPNLDDDDSVRVEHNDSEDGCAWLAPDTLVIPAEPSAKVESAETEPGAVHHLAATLCSTGERIYVKPAPGGGGWVETPEPTPIQLQVGHRYRRRDGAEVECAEHQTGLAGSDCEFLVRGPGSEHHEYAASGQYVENHSDPFDLVEDLGPVKTEERLRLKVGERYERRDGVLVDCVEHYPALAGEDDEFECVAPNGRRTAYHANGQFIDQPHPVDIIRHVGPTPVAPARPDVEKWDRYTVQGFRDRMCKASISSTATAQRVANEMLAELEPKQPDAGGER